MAWTDPRTWTTGELITAAIMNQHVRDNLRYLEEIAYVEFTADVPVTATSSGTSNLVVSSGAITYEAAPIVIEFYCAQAQPDTGAAGRQLFIGIYDNGAANGTARIAQVRTPAAASLVVPVWAERRFSPSAASHTYEIRAYVSAGTGTLFAGAGGNDLVAPGFISVRGRAT